MRVRVVGAAWIRDGRLLAARRGPGRARAGYWELPGGKVEPGETDQEALQRELREELGLAVVVGERIGVAVFAEPHAEIELVAYRVEADSEPVLTEHDAVRWLAEAEVDDVRWAPADVPLVDRLRALLAAPRRPCGTG